MRRRFRERGGVIGLRVRVRGGLTLSPGSSSCQSDLRISTAVTFFVPWNCGRGRERGHGMMNKSLLNGATAYRHVPILEHIFALEVVAIDSQSEATPPLWMVIKG